MLNSSASQINPPGPGGYTKTDNRWSNGRFKANPKTPEELHAELQKCIVTATENIAKPPACFYLRETLVGTLGNISMFIGKAKQGKTFAVTMAMAAAEEYVPYHDFIRICPPNGKQKVLLFDTEQSRYHLQKVVKRVARLAGINEPDNLTTYGLRPYAPSERLDLIEHQVYNTPNLGVIVIDGVRDLISSINDEEQSTMISSKLLKWSQELEIHIVVVLHMNKSDNNARGHLGTELQNKAESIFSVSKSEQDKNIIIIEAISTRGMEPSPVAFTIDQHGLPDIIKDWSPEDSKPASKQQKVSPWEVATDTHYIIVEPLFKRKKEYSSKELQEALSMQLKNHLNQSAVSRERVAEWRAYLIKEGIIIESGTPSTRSVRFSLNPRRGVVN